MLRKFCKRRLRLVRTYASSLIRCEVRDLLLYAVRLFLRGVSILDFNSKKVRRVLKKLQGEKSIVGLGQGDGCTMGTAMST
jgi:hypothetical protein